jgi:hypothetical protein
VPQEILFRPNIFASLFTFSVPSFSSCLGLLYSSLSRIWGARTENCLVSLKHQGAAAVPASGHTLDPWFLYGTRTEIIALVVWLLRFFRNSFSHNLPNAVAHIVVDKVIISVVLIFGFEGEDLGSLPLSYTAFSSFCP